MLLASLLLLGCAPVPAQHDCDLAGPHVVVGTSDFASGALAAVTLDGDEVCVADRLVSTGPDAVVRVTDHHTWVVNRTGSDTLLAYEHGDYATPALEVVVAPGGNAHDLVAHEGQLFVALYDEPRVLVLDLDGVPVGEVDLSPHADADGLPDPATLQVEPTPPFMAVMGSDLAVDECGGVYVHANLGFGYGGLARYDPSTGTTQQLGGGIDHGYGTSALRFGVAPGTEHQLSTMTGGWSTIQLEWIEQTLAASTADWLFVVGHFPVYSGGSHGNTPELQEVRAVRLNAPPGSTANMCTTCSKSFRC